MVTTLSLCALVVAASPAVAVAYFDNTSKVAELEPFKKGLADMLITDLANVKGLTVVEREKLGAVLAELDLSKSPFIDPASAQKLGKGLAATHVLTGAYLVAGDGLRIDAKVISVATGAVVAADKVEGKKDDLFDIEKDLAELVIRSLQLKLGFDERKELRRLATHSYPAFVSYAQGLDAKDRGDEAKAAELFRAAVAADPDFKAAKTSLGRLTVIEKRLEQARAIDFDAAFASLDAKAPDVAARLQALAVVAGFGAAPESQARRFKLLTFILEHDLRPVDTSTGSPIAVEPELFFNTVPLLTDKVLRTRAGPAFEYFLLRYPAELYTRSWYDTWKANRDAPGVLDAPKPVRDASLKVLDAIDAKVATKKP